MTVFKGFLLLVKRNLGIFFLYFGIFMSICILIQAMTGGEGTNQFREESLQIAVLDRDGGKLAESLREDLGEKHQLVELEDDKRVIQENLFYRNVYYVVTIPEGFEQKYLEDGEKLKTTKVPGTVSAYFIDQQIDAFLNDVRILARAGFSVEEASAEALRIGKLDTEVDIVDKNGHGGRMEPHAYMLQFLPYLFLGVLCYIIGYVMITFRKKDVKRRLLCSCVSLRMQNAGLMAGFLVVGVGFWLCCMAMPAVMYGKEFCQDDNLIYYLLNSFAMVLVALAISFVVGVLVENENVINGAANVISLGMCFTCGVFVSISVLSEGVRKAAHFLPVYWYETVNEIIGNNTQFTAAQSAAVWKGIGIQLLFAALFLSIGLAASKYKRQE